MKVLNSYIPVIVREVTMKKKFFVIGGIIILAGAAGAGGWYYYKENYANSSAASGQVAYVTKISTLLGEDSGVVNRFA